MASDCPEGEISDTGYSLEEEIVYGDEVRRLRTLIQSLSYDEKKDRTDALRTWDEIQGHRASPLRISLTIARKTCISNY
jgi:hypothetical protein